jgi:uncharacterized protein YbjQ (UPF0145 family)
MIFTTTSFIEGHPVRQYLGILAVEVVLGVNLVRDLFGGVRDAIGGQSGSLEKALAEARDAAFKKLERQAQAIGADAVVGIAMDYETAGATNGMWVVTLTGTAVRTRAE